jgi:hypothetical protein
LEFNVTIASERTRAVNYTYEFLRDLIDPKKTPRVPKEVRRRASSLLRHYPSRLDMEMAVEEGSSRFGDDMNPFGTKTLADVLRGQGHA